MGLIAGTGVSTAERIATLEATELARSALVRYADATDAKDIEAMTDLFALDATMHVDDAVFAGRAAIIDYFETAFRSAPSPKAHFVTNVRVVAASPAEVALASYFLYLSTGVAPSLDGWGMYRDTIRVADGRAEIVSKHMTGSWNGADAPNGQIAWMTEPA